MSVVVTTVSSEGKALDPTYELVSIDVVKEINRIPHAQLVLADGDAAQQTFAISNEAVFEPGKQIEIKLRYEGVTKDVTVFKGVVVGHGVSAGAHGSFLTVELKDTTVRSTLVRKSVIFRDMKDDAIIKQILSNQSLKAGTVAATQAEHPELVQFNCTDWDFILTRAEANGLVVKVDDGAVSVAKIDLSGSASHTFTFGIDDIYDFDIEADAEHQLPGVESMAWDIAAQAPTRAAKAKNFSLSQGNLTGANLAQALGVSNPGTLTSMTPLIPAELQAWSDGRLMRSRLSLLRGRLGVSGLADIGLLDLIEVAGIGKRFNGKTIVTGLRHRVDTNGWQTDIQFGLSAKPFAERRDLTEVPAAGLLPAVNGLQIGIVDKFEEDPAGELRVKVLLPGIDSQEGIVWARLASPEAGKDRGYFFRPEPGDEVVVGFFNDDPRQAVVLGALYSSVNTAPEAMGDLSADNINKGIVTKGGTIIQFVDDEKASLIIQTASENKIVLNDDEKLIEISDQHGNSIKLSSDGVEIVSAKDLKIEASGNVEISGQQVNVK